MKVSVLNQKGKEVEQIELAKDVFDVVVNKKVLAQYVYSYLSNQRQGNAHTKDRSEVRGGGKKPWKQKGTGRARFGSSRNPIWRKGGVAFGPTNQVNWKKKLTKNFKISAMKNALSFALDNDQLMVVDTIELKDMQTKQALEIKKTLKLKNKFTLVTPNADQNLLRAFSNLKSVKVTNSSDLNAYDIVSGGKIVLLKDSVELISKRLKK